MLIVFPPLPLSVLSSFSFRCALQDGFGQTWWTGNMSIPLQFASVYVDQMSVWSEYILEQTNKQKREIRPCEESVKNCSIRRRGYLWSIHHPIITRCIDWLDVTIKRQSGSFLFLSQLRLPAGAEKISAARAARSGSRGTYVIQRHHHCEAAVRWRHAHCCQPGQTLDIKACSKVTRRPAWKR